MKNPKQKKIVYSSIFATITMATILGAAIEAIVGFIAVYFFAPFWNYIMNKSKTSVDKQDQ
jgi:uncharacterized membrane protein YuzA (DUF378 family)